MTDKNRIEFKKFVLIEMNLNDDCVRFYSSEWQSGTNILARKNVWWTFSKKFLSPRIIVGVTSAGGERGCQLCTVVEKKVQMLRRLE